MTLTKLQITNGIKKATGTDDADWDAGDLDLYANKSWWKVMDEFDFREKEAPPVTFSTVAGQIVYAMQTIMGATTFDAIQRIAIEDTDGKHEDLLLISDFNYENEYQNSSTIEARPTRYFRRGSNLYLFDTPDQIYSITVYSLAVLSDIPVGGPVIPQAWHEAIQYGAIYRAFADLGDLVKAQFWKSMYKDEINGLTPVKVKELADTKMAGVECPGRDYP